MNEICVLAAAIEAGNETLPPNIGKLIHHAPESFDDARACQIAVTVRSMRAAGEPVNFPAVGEKHLPFINYISELASSALPLDSAEYEAAQCWKVFQIRRAKVVGEELIQNLNSSPDLASSIIGAARSALDAVTSDTANGLPELIDAADFISKPIEPAAELVVGILHKGSKLAFGGSSKSFKTWCLLDLAISVATGADWLGRRTAQGKVLFLNFEIQQQAWQCRIVAVARAKAAELRTAQIILWNLRGHAADFRQIVPRVIERCRAENFALIVLDPIYKLYGGTDENAAGDVAELLNSLERLANETGAAIPFGAHFAKGNASAKEAIDRISGSGVFARDPDSLLIFTKHEADDAFTVEPILRNFAPVAPFAVRWQFPLMHRADDLDPAKLKQAGGRPAKHRPQDLLDLLPPDGLTHRDWLDSAAARKISERTFYRLRDDLEKVGKVLNSIPVGKWLPIQTKTKP